MTGVVVGRDLGRQAKSQESEAFLVISAFPLVCAPDLDSSIVGVGKAVGA